MQEILNNIIWVFNANPVAQSFAIVAFFVNCYSITRKHDREILVLSTITNSLLAASFTLLWFYVAAGVFVINIFRWIFVLKFHKNIKIAIWFFILYWINAFVNYGDYYSWFAIIGSFLFSYSFFFLSWSWIPFRSVMWIWSIMWIIFHFTSQSIWWFLLQTFVFILNWITIYRLYIDKDFKQDKIVLTK